MHAITQSNGAPPMPGVLWGAYPERRTDEPHRGIGGWGWLGAKTAAARYQAVVAAARVAQRAWSTVTSDEHATRLAQLRGRLRREPLDSTVCAQALGCVAEAAQRSLGIELYDSQLFAAGVLLDGHLAEMATGEGKTYAAAAAAAVAALAGIPVHVITANDYLVTRDAAALAPLYGVLGLRVGAVASLHALPTRSQAYRADIVYCTARELVFDYLRDGLARGEQRRDLVRRAAALAGAPAPTLLRGLCMAIVDEADSVLLDEASMPLILSEQIPDPGRRALLWQALALARRLAPGDDFALIGHERKAELTARGRERLAQLTASLGETWASRRRREELLGTALTALHGYHRDRDYLVRSQRIDIIDQVSGRAAPGRVWSRGLHGLLELKEDCPLSPETRTIAQITYQRFFPRYLRLCGMSGTLTEARRELRSVYGLRVVPVPLRRPSRRSVLPARLYPDARSRWAAVVRRVEQLRAVGRPVLIGTDSVADSEALSGHLSAAGIEHAVLNARHDRTEAEIVARAGTSATVTVATHMAGRGTDIVLGAGVRARGGLHVLSCQHNGARRLDRQLAGRCARQGDPGSVETWLALDRGRIGAQLSAILRGLIRRRDQEGALRLPAWLLKCVASMPQRIEEQREQTRRRRLLQQDLEWRQRCTFAPSIE